MGAPKQKWTFAEEADLKAGVAKHGVGKWRTILREPEFRSVLHLRSNVDLKDKWRNMSVMANGWGSRQRARLALKRVPQAPKNDNPLAPTTVGHGDEESRDAKPLPSSSGSPQIGGPKRSMIRLDNVIMEAINNLMEPGGSNKSTIGRYIETKHRYRIVSPDKEKIPTQSCGSSAPRVDKDGTSVATKNQIVLEVQKTSLTPQEAAAAAAQAVAVAEAAMAEAEEAARAAEAAEADAEAAQAFAEAAMKTLKEGTSRRLKIRS